MKFIKKNQIIIYVIALMLVTAGYLNYTGSDSFKSAIATSASEEELGEMANIGDAQLVSSNDIATESNTENNVTTQNEKDSNVNSNINSTTNNTNKTTEQTSSNASSTNVSDYFTTSKLERDKMYSQMLETYENILNSSNALETQKQSATEEITKINSIKNSIMISENLIKTKGFENNIIFVNGASVSVIVGADELKQEEVAQIQNIVSREMGATVENIHISSKKG